MFFQIELYKGKQGFFKEKMNISIQVLLKSLFQSKIEYSQISHNQSSTEYLYGIMICFKKKKISEYN